MRRLLVLSPLLLFVIGSCSSASSSSNAGQCVTVSDQLAKREIDCAAAACKPGDDCNCLKQGMAFHRDSHGAVTCVALPANDYDRCVFEQLQSNRAMSADTTGTAECDCMVKQVGYWLAKDKTCLKTKEDYCFRTTKDPESYGTCMCTTTAWSASGDFSHPVVDADTGACVTKDICATALVGLQRWVNDAVCVNGQLQVPDVSAEAGADTGADTGVSGGNGRDGGPRKGDGG